MNISLIIIYTFSKAITIYENTFATKFKEDVKDISSMQTKHFYKMQLHYKTFDSLMSRINHIWKLFSFHF